MILKLANKKYILNTVTLEKQKPETGFLTKGYEKSLLIH